MNESKKLDTKLKNGTQPLEWNGSQGAWLTGWFSKVKGLFMLCISISTICPTHAYLLSFKLEYYKNKTYFSRIWENLLSIKYKM